MSMLARDLLRLVPRTVERELAFANHPSGAPSERDMKVLTPSEQKKLHPALAKIAKDLREDGAELSNAAVAREAMRRLRIIIKTVADPEGNLVDIERIRDPNMRELVGNMVSLRAALHNWQTKDPEVDGVQGASVERAYEELPPAQREIVVAVIDSGVDIEHEDLKGKIWTNPKEIPGNGIDDDGNGYVDDVHGWNFLGSVDENGNPINIGATTLEVTREMVRMERLASERELTPQEETYLAKLEKEVAAGRERVAAQEKKTGRPGPRYYDPSFDPRREIIGDDPADFSNRYYGNNDVKGPNSRHGTHVAGIIAAGRNNGKGSDGVAESVKIMSVRAIPDGDEYDKDIANAVRYAADNGAHIINMSFGKSYSPYPEKVREAMLYAASKGVVLVHAAGNDGLNNDGRDRFPSASLNGETEVDNWLDVGAAYGEMTGRMPAIFSNYGKETVDLFAPGVDIYGPLPENEYGALSGTSMAAPVVAGVLAQLMAAYPEVPPERMRQVVLETVRTFPDLKVWVPGRGTKKRIDFASLSKTGGVVDMLAAVRRLNASVNA